MGLSAITDIAAGSGPWLPRGPGPTFDLQALTPQRGAGPTSDLEALTPQRGAGPTFDLEALTPQVPLARCTTISSRHSSHHPLVSCPESPGHVVLALPSVRHAFPYHLLDPIHPHLPGLGV